MPFLKSRRKALCLDFRNYLFEESTRISRKNVLLRFVFELQSFMFEGSLAEKFHLSQKNFIFELQCFPCLKEVLQKRFMFVMFEFKISKP